MSPVKQAPADIEKLPLSFGMDIRKKFIEARKKRFDK